MRNFRDWLWNYRAAVTPGVTAILSFIWFVIEPSPEPAVVTLGALFATAVAFYQLQNIWHTDIRGKLFSIHFRGDPETGCPKFLQEVIKGNYFICKHYVEEHDAEFRTVHLDLIGRLNVDELHEISNKYGCKLYKVECNGNLVWETDAI